MHGGESRRIYPPHFPAFSCFIIYENSQQKVERSRRMPNAEMPNRNNFYDVVELGHCKQDLCSRRAIFHRDSPASLPFPTWDWMMNRFESSIAPELFMVDLLVKLPIVDVSVKPASRTNSIHFFSAASTESHCRESQLGCKITIGSPALVHSYCS